MKHGYTTTSKVCQVGIMIAMYFILAKLTIPIGNLRITMAPLPIVVLAVMYGQLDSAIAALLGEFMIQAFGQYGLTPTTPLWCLPPVFRAVIVGWGCRILDRRVSVDLPRHRYWFFAILMLGAIATTIGNTAVTWLDSVIYGYYSYAYVFGQLVIRLITGVLTAVVTGLLTLPIVKALKRINNRAASDKII